METKFTKGKWTFSPMKGTHGHCFAAQVWDEEGHNLATIETKNGAIEASANAKLIAAAPEMFNLISEIDAWLSFNVSPNKEDIKTLRESLQNIIKKATE